MRVGSLLRLPLSQLIRGHRIDSTHASIQSFASTISRSINSANIHVYSVVTIFGFARSSNRAQERHPINNIQSCGATKFALPLRLDQQPLCTISGKIYAKSCVACLFAARIDSSRYCILSFRYLESISARCIIQYKGRSNHSHFRLYGSAHFMHSCACLFCHCLACLIRSFW